MTAPKKAPARRAKAPAKEPVGKMKPNHTLNVAQSPEETGAQAVARKLLQPDLKNAIAASAFSKPALGSSVDAADMPGIGDFIGHIQSEGKKAADGDIAQVSRILSAQAITLDSMFAELARRAAANMGAHMEATERYARLALKAQSNCRATLEALAKLHQPAKEQIVRHIHVNEGGQAIIADQFNNYTGVHGNAGNVTQSDAARYSGGCAPMLGAHPLGQALPIASREGQEAVPDARGH